MQLLVVTVVLLLLSSLPRCSVGFPSCCFNPEKFMVSSCKPHWDMLSLAIEKMVCGEIGRLHSEHYIIVYTYTLSYTTVHGVCTMHVCTVMIATLCNFPSLLLQVLECLLQDWLSYVGL